MTECECATGASAFLGVAITVAAVCLGWGMATLQYMRKTPAEKRLDRDIEEAGQKLIAADRQNACTECGVEIKGSRCVYCS